MQKYFERLRLRRVADRIMAKNKDERKVGGILPTGNTFFGDEAKHVPDQFIGIPPIWTKNDSTPSKPTFVSKFREALQPVFDKFRKL